MLWYRLYFLKYRVSFTLTLGSNQLIWAITLCNTLTIVFPLQRSLNRRISCVAKHSWPIIDSKRIQIRFHLLHPWRVILHSQEEDGHPRLLCFSKSWHGEAPAVQDRRQLHNTFVSRSRSVSRETLVDIRSRCHMFVEFVIKLLLDFKSKFSKNQISMKFSQADI